MNKKMNRNSLFLMNLQQNKMFPECKHCKMLQKNYSNLVLENMNNTVSIMAFLQSTDGQ